MVLFLLFKSEHFNKIILPNRYLPTPRARYRQTKIDVMVSPADLPNLNIINILRGCCSEAYIVTEGNSKV